MVTTGSKLFFGYSFVSLVAAVLYGTSTELEGSIELKGQVPFVALPDGIVDGLVGPITLGYKGGVGDHLGYSVLIGLAAIFLLLGVMTTAFRDADADSVAQLSNGVLGRLRRPSLLSFWPPLAAFGAGCIVIGLAVSSMLVALGLVVFVLVLLEWTASAWSESASGDPEVNRIARNRLMFPLEVPILAVVILGGMVLAVSRIFLAVSEFGSVFAAIGIAAVLLAMAAIVATRDTVDRNLVVTLLAVGAAVLLIAGVMSAVAGNRDFEEHESGDAEQAASVLAEDGW